MYRCYVGPAVFRAQALAEDYGKSAAARLSAETRGAVEVGGWVGGCVANIENNKTKKRTPPSWIREFS